MRNREDLHREGAADARTWAVGGELIADISVAQTRAAQIEADQFRMLGRLQQQVLAGQLVSASPEAPSPEAPSPEAPSSEAPSSEATAWQMTAITCDLARELRVSEHVAQSMMATGYTLVTQLTETLSAWSRGLLTRRQVEAIVRATAGLTGDELLRFERTLIDEAIGRGLAPHEIRRLALRLRETRDPQSLGERHRRARRDRHVSVSPAEDGMAWLSVLMSAVDAVACADRIRHIARGVQTAAEASPDNSAADRTLSNLQADVLRDLLVHGTVPGMSEPSPDEFHGDHQPGATGQAGLGSGIHARVTVTVPITALITQAVPGASAAAAPIAGLEGHGPIDARGIRDMLGENSTISRMLTDPAGAPLALQRRQYRPTEDLRQFIRTRDGTCRFPGCVRPASQCEIDHTINWEWQGPTDPDNLACLCRRHHVLKHQTDWKVMQVGGARLHWTSPTGAGSTTHPAHQRHPTDASGAPPPF